MFRIGWKVKPNGMTTVVRVETEKNEYIQSSGSRNYIPARPSDAAFGLRSIIAATIKNHEKGAVRWQSYGNRLLGDSVLRAGPSKK